jgi:hypothetical protein
MEKCPKCGKGFFSTKRFKYLTIGDKEYLVCPICIKENEQERKNPQNKSEPDKTESSEVITLKQLKKWFVGVEDATGATHYYDKKEVTQTLRSDILEGKYQKDNTTVLYSKKVDGKWEKTSSTLLEFSKKFFKLRVLYQPVWSYAMSGLKWGTIIGIGLKAVDSLIGLASADVVVTIICLLVLGLFFIPRVGPYIDIAIIIALSRFFDIMWILGFYFGIAIVGIMLASLPGMAIGGAIGLSRRDTITLARDAPPESKNIHITAFVLPLVIGIVLIAVYFFVILPWMVSDLIG